MQNQSGQGGHHANGFYPPHRGRGYRNNAPANRQYPPQMAPRPVAQQPPPCARCPQLVAEKDTAHREMTAAIRDRDAAVREKDRAISFRQTREQEYEGLRTSSETKLETQRTLVEKHLAKIEKQTYALTNYENATKKRTKLIEALQNTVDFFSRDNAALRERVFTTEDIITAHELSNQSLGKENENGMLTRASLEEKKCAKSVEAEETRERKMEDIEKVSLEVATKLKGAESTIDGHISTITELKSQIQSLQQKLAIAESTIGDHDSTIAKLQAVNTDLEQELTTAKSTIDRHITTFADIASEKEGVEKELADVHATNERNGSTIEDYKTEKEGLKNDLMKLEKELADAHSTNERYGSAIDDYKTEKEGLKNDLMKLEKEKEDIVATRDSTQQKLKAANDQLEILATENTNLKTGNKNKEEVLTKLRQENQDVVAAQESVEKELEIAHEEINSHSAELTVLKLVKASTEESFTKFKQEHQVIVDAKETADKNLEKASEEIKELTTSHQSTLSNITFKHTKLVATLEERDRKIEAYNFFAFLSLLALLLAGLSYFALPSAQMIYEKVSTWFTNSVADEIANAGFSPSISALARLQSVVSPVCLDTMSLGPDVEVLEYGTHGACGMDIKCLFVKGMNWLGQFY